jgi:hypothetical protein
MKEDFVPLFDDKKDAVRFRAVAGHVRLVLIESLNWSWRKANGESPLEKRR